MPTVDEQTLQYAASVARRVKSRDAAVRWGFIRNVDTTPQVAPMAAMLRGGRGGAVRLKLYLSFLWFAVAPPHDVTYPARAWAGLLGLDDPEVNGARRIIDAITWLDQHQLVTTERRAGRPTRVRLLNDDGSGEPYELPGATVEWLRGKGVEGPLLHRNLYVRVPATFWTNGWIATLSGPGVAMWLSLLCEQADKPPDTELWLSPSEADKRIGLSEQTRSKGLRELVQHELVTLRRRPIGRDVFDFRRLRNVYVLEMERLAEQADA